MLLVEDVILGCGSFNLLDDKETGKISWDIFHPENQGKGLGTALTNYRIERVKKISVMIIGLKVLIYIDWKLT